LKRHSKDLSGVAALRLLSDRFWRNLAVRANRPPIFASAGADKPVIITPAAVGEAKIEFSVSADTVGRISDTDSSADFIREPREGKAAFLLYRESLGCILRLGFKAAEGGGLRVILLLFSRFLKKPVC